MRAVWIGWRWPDSGKPPYAALLNHCRVPVSIRLAAHEND